MNFQEYLPIYVEKHEHFIVLSDNLLGWAKDFTSAPYVCI